MWLPCKSSGRSVWIRAVPSPNLTIALTSSRTWPSNPNASASQVTAAPKSRHVNEGYTAPPGDGPAASGPDDVHAPPSRVSQPVVQVGHPVSLDDLRIVKQQRGPGVVTEVPDAGAKHDRHQVDPDLVDQPCLEGLAGEVAGSYRDVSVAGDGLRLG